MLPIIPTARIANRTIIIVHVFMVILTYSTIRFIIVRFPQEFYFIFFRTIVYDRGSYKRDKRTGVPLEKIQATMKTRQHDGDELQYITV